MVSRLPSFITAGHLHLFLAFTLFIVLFVNPSGTMAQEQDSSKLHPHRLKLLAIGSTIGYSGLLLGLNSLWYQDHPQTTFHFFNDNRQWMQVDKAGHTYSAFQLSRAGSEALLWAGMDSRQASLIGSLGGWLFMFPIEILDGHSADYGASWGDLAANSLGSLLFSSQVLLWDDIRLKPKFSFHPSPFAAERPNMLGHNFHNQLLKDYNGQTYWLSASIHKFLPNGNKFPHWLNFAVGYGTEGMVYAHPSASYEAGYNPLHQFYLGPDIDLSFIHTRKKAIKVLLFILEGIKLPSPALEINKNRLRLHPVYF